MADPRHDPIAALRHREFRNLISGGFLTSSAVMIQEVALAYELYLMTRDPLILGFLGLAQALPFISLALFGGYLADRREKRALMQVALGVMLAGSLLLTWATLPSTRARLGQDAMLWTVYGVFVLLGLARGLYSPASAALRAFLVPREIYANAATWATTFWQAAAILSPMMAGLLYAALGLSGTLLLVVGLFAAANMLLTTIAPRPLPAGERPSDGLWLSLREGIAYVWRTRIILYAISLDMFSVLFGGVVALLPIFAEDILKVGPEGLGVLRSAPAVGALLTVVICAWHPPQGQPWRNLLLAVVGFGIATIVFGLSDIFWLSCVALFLTGACDSVSVVIRGTILQVTPPDHLRGRVQSVNSIFISSSNELGAFESGVAAKLIGAVPAVLFGGAATLGIAAYVWRRSKDLLAVRL